MLTKDANKRINWKELFERELSYAESKILLIIEEQKIMNNMEIRYNKN